MFPRHKFILKTEECPWKITCILQVLQAVENELVTMIMSELTETTELTK